MYASGNLTYDTHYMFEGEEKVFQLPHSCDEWVIGDLEHAKLLHKELEELIEKHS